MSRIDESIGFYRKMSELQERLRKSEEERLKLEEKFAVLMRSCHDEEEERLNNLRGRYEAFLEEERQRRERNERILQALDRIESRTAMLTAKSERLRLLRRHYEAYMLKIYPGWKYVTSKFVDGQPSSQKLDPLRNKLNSEADRTDICGGLRSSSTLFPADSNRAAARTLDRSYNTGGAVPTNHQTVSASRTTGDVISAARNVDGQALPGTALPTVNIADTQEVHNSLIMIGEHSVPVAKKAPQVYTQERLGSRPNSAAGEVECNKMRQLDDYLGRAAEMLKLSRADDSQRDKNVNGYFNEIDADSLKDAKHVGNSVEFELEQNTSGDLLNVSLSDDGVLQEETNRTLISLSQTHDNNRNLSQTQKENVSAVNKTDEVLNKQAGFHESMDNEDVLLSKKFEDLHQELELAHPEQKNKETAIHRVDAAEDFGTALDRKDGREFDNQHSYPQNSTSVAGGESAVPDSSIYCGEEVLRTEEENEVSHQQFSTLNDGVQNCDNGLMGQKIIQGFERSVQDPLECEAHARRDNADESSAEEPVYDDREVPVSGSICVGEEDRTDKLYEGEEPGSRQLTEQEQRDENEQQYYQQDAGDQEGDQYYQYGEDEMYQQQYDQEHAEGYDQQYMIQEGEQYYQQYGEQVEGEYDQEYVDQEGLQYGEQDGQYADWQEGLCHQQYVQQQASQYNEYHEDHQLEPGLQHISEDKQTVQDEEYNEEDSKEHNDEVFRRDLQDGVCDGTSYEEGKYQEQVKRYETMQGGVGERSQESGSAGGGGEKTLSKVVAGKTDDSTALPQQPDISSGLTEASPSGNVQKYHQLLGETADVEQSDTDEMEMQLAALVESQQGSKTTGKQLQQSVSSRVKVTGNTPVEVAPPAVGNTRPDSHRNVDEVACKTDVKTSEGTGHEANSHGTPEAHTLSMPEIQSEALQKEGDLLQVPQTSVPRAGSRKLPGLTKMLESDTESLQLDATIPNEDSDDFDFSSDQ